jgi:hypothetical protein
MMQTESRLAVLEARVTDCDLSVRVAEQALAKYLSEHPNAHAFHRNANGISIRLNAMDADLTLTNLERQRDEALEQFHSALRNLADAKEQMQKEAQHEKRLC